MGSSDYLVVVLTARRIPATAGQEAHRPDLPLKSEAPGTSSPITQRALHSALLAEAGGGALP